MLVSEVTTCISNMRRVRRRPPDADIHISPAQRLGPGAALEQPQRPGAQRSLEQDQQARNDQGNHPGAGQGVHHPAAVVGPQSLRGQARHPHLQEIEGGEQQVDDGRPQRHRRQIARFPKITDDRGVDGALQRHHCVRQHHRQGDGGNAGVGDAAGVVFGRGRMGHGGLGGGRGSGLL
jgi:hypothetical protein